MMEAIVIETTILIPEIMTEEIEVGAVIERRDLLTEDQGQKVQGTTEKDLPVSRKDTEENPKVLKETTEKDHPASTEDSEKNRKVSRGHIAVGPEAQRKSIKESLWTEKVAPDP